MACAVGAITVTFGNFWLMLQRVEERGDTIGFVSRGWEGAGDCNELGDSRSVRGRLDVGTRLKGEAMTGNGLGGV